MEIIEKRNFVISIIIAMIITFSLTFITIWQLIIIPGIAAGLLNKKMMRGICAGSIGIAVVWLFYMIYAFGTRNAYLNIDQFAGLIFGDLGYGWLVVIIILLFGILFGALGGAIGSGITIWID
ncbi:MAG: hypothetical protein ACTSQJ_00750 [Promethearchaeota archaeon]